MCCKKVRADWQRVSIWHTAGKCLVLNITGWICNSNVVYNTKWNKDIDKGFNIFLNCSGRKKSAPIFIWTFFYELFFVEWVHISLCGIWKCSQRIKLTQPYLLLANTSLQFFMHFLISFIIQMIPSPPPSPTFPVQS